MSEKIKVCLVANADQARPIQQVLLDTRTCNCNLLHPDGFLKALDLNWPSYDAIIFDAELLADGVRRSSLGEQLSQLSQLPLLIMATAHEMPALQPFISSRNLSFDLLPKEGLHADILLHILLNAVRRKKLELQISSHTRQHEALFELGSLVSTDATLEKLFDKASLLTAKVLGADFTKVMELTTPESALEFKAGQGWDAFPLCNSLATASQEIFTLQASYPKYLGDTFNYEPVIVENLACDTRFYEQVPRSDQAIRSGISIVIPSKQAEQPLGVLAAYSTQQKNFSAEDAFFLQSVGNILGVAIQKRRLETQLLDSLRAAHKSAELLKQMVLSIRDYAIFMIDTQGLIINWNSGAERITGYKSEQAIGQHFSLFYPSDAPMDFEHSLTVAAHSGRFESEGVCIRKDGSRFIASILIVPVYDEENQLQGYTEITKDVTSERQSQERLRLALDAAQLNSWEWDIPSGRVSWVSGGPSTQELKQATQAEFIGQMLPEELPHIQESIHQTLATGRDLNLEFRRRINGELRWTIAKGRVFYDEHRHPLRMVGISMDITEKKRAEEELKFAKEAAERANEAKSAFLANMSHEIRTPLNAIMGFAELVENSKVSAEKQQEFIATITRNGKFLSQLLDDILDLSKVEAGKLSAEQIRCSLPEIVTDVINLLGKQAVDKGIYLRLTSESELPEFILSDPNRLKQILINIIGNAVKFTQKGGVHVNVSLRQPSRHNPAQICFVVKDTGPGIQTEQQSRLFQAFSQADASMARKYGGTGLGLILARKLAQLLGGTVELMSSKPGLGSSFRIIIESVDAQGSCRLCNGSDQGEFKFPQPIGLNLENDRLLSGIAVLIVEDAPDSRALASQILSQYGAKVALAENGLEALRILKDIEFDVVLMDLQMPLLDGFEATAEVRKRGYCRPILAVSAAAMKDEKDKAMAVGCDDHLTKPFSISILLQKILDYAKKEPRLKNYSSVSQPASYRGSHGRALHH